MVDGNHRFNQPTRLRLQHVAGGVAHPRVMHVRRHDRSAVGKTRMLSEGDEPGAAVLVELPRRGEPWAETSLAIHSSQRLVDLPEQQQLAVVRGARCVARIDALGEGDRRDGLARLGDQCAFEGGRVRRWRQDDWCWRR